tara:strand:+ start:334 stop:468 length:135 start_codon:yes stop_codon:yes gene_type:complete
MYSRACAGVSMPSVVHSCSDAARRDERTMSEVRGGGEKENGALM